MTTVATEQDGLTREDIGLTREDISYLRRADEVYAQHRGEEWKSESPVGNVLVALKRGKRDDQFSQDVRVPIVVDGNGAPGNFANPVPRTIVRLLRAGDKVYLYWYPDAGTNEYCKDAGLHVDYLYLHVTRGKQQFEYLASVSVCPHNSARMCKS